MAIDLAFRRRAVRTLTNQIGCYVLCDLDQVPIYVGQSVDGIRSRVNRHLTSARSDIIANRQVDVWEIAWVWAYPVANKSDIGAIEDALFHEFHSKSALMNGKVPKRPPHRVKVPEPSQRVQVMADAEIDGEKGSGPSPSPPGGTLQPDRRPFPGGQEFKGNRRRDPGALRTTSKVSQRAPRPRNGGRGRQR